ncbi:MAPEG family protein [Ferrimonas sediminicola]|uniref:MAPEG family protein n=1 Tax=Ferrimonas sediminicola TaxID=2569538 RepID=A0A4U1BER7_9GAMM|nr:MAPEG family protein [Ferrimonas sediminicola]TKB48840.1 MAPEG family protein [Ferrimonas sediminicola]
MPLTITALYLSFTALLALVLAYRVVRLRRSRGIGLGNGQDKDLTLSVRCHANLLEYAPLVMLMLASAELNGAPGLLLHLCGSAWLLGRVLHPWGLTRGRGGYHLGRFWGTLLTWCVTLALVGLNLTLAVA